MHFLQAVNKHIHQIKEQMFGLSPNKSFIRPINTGVALSESYSFSKNISENRKLNTNDMTVIAKEKR